MCMYCICTCVRASQCAIPTRSSRFSSIPRAARCRQRHLTQSCSCTAGSRKPFLDLSLVCSFVLDHNQQNKLLSFPVTGLQLRTHIIGSIDCIFCTYRSSTFLSILITCQKQETVFLTCITSSFLTPLRFRMMVIYEEQSKNVSSCTPYCMLCTYSTCTTTVCAFIYNYTQLQHSYCLSAGGLLILISPVHSSVLFLLSAIVVLFY